MYTLYRLVYYWYNAVSPRKGTKLKTPHSKIALTAQRYFPTKERPKITPSKIALKVHSVQSYFPRKGEKLKIPQ